LELGYKVFAAKIRWLIDVFGVFEKTEKEGTNYCGNFLE
jgi:hypothetical protein